jgi:hypothetical protein
MVMGPGGPVGGWMRMHLLSRLPQLPQVPLFTYQSLGLHIAPVPGSPSMSRSSRQAAIASCSGGPATVKMPMRAAAMSSAGTSARSSPLTRPASRMPLMAASSSVRVCPGTDAREKLDSWRRWAPRIWPRPRSAVSSGTSTQRFAPVAGRRRGRQTLEVTAIASETPRKPAALRKVSSDATTVAPPSRRRRRRHHVGTIRPA